MEGTDEKAKAVGLRWCYGLLTALWAPVRRYFYLTRRDAKGFAVWCVLMALTLGIKWAYPKWEAARLSEDRLPAAAIWPAAGAGTGGGAVATAGGFAASGSRAAASGAYGATAGHSATVGGGSQFAASGAYSTAGGHGASAGGASAGTSGSGRYPAGGAASTGASPDTAAGRPSPRAASHSPYGSPYRKKAFTVDLNRGDTFDFQELRGIGPAYARRIVAYRERLGGFVDKAQLLEVWGVDSALYDRIAPSLELSRAAVRRLNINQLSVQELKQHPYLDYYQAKEIVRHRERYGPFQSPSDLKKVNLIDAETYARIAPYVSTAAD